MIRTVQMGAVIGRQFSDALLRTVSPLGEEDLRQDLRCLLDSELLYQRGVGKDATYQFKHALIQDAAYGSLLRRNRQQLHRKIAQVLETQFPQTQDTQPELLAHHFTEAGLYEQAVAWWLRAGQLANERAAHQEAIRYLRKGLDVVAAMPNTPERAQHELDLQIELIQTLRVTAGQSSPEVEYVLTRAHALCEQLAQPSKIFPVLQGLTSLYYTRGKFQKSIEWGERALVTAQMQDDPMRRLMAHKHLGLNFYSIGEFTRFGMHMEQAIALYEQQRSNNEGERDRNLLSPGTARRHQPGPSVAAAGQTPGCLRPARAGVWLVYRGL